MSGSSGARFDRRIALLTLLYFCQGLPGGFLAVDSEPETLEEVAAVPRLVQGKCLLNVVRGGKTPDLPLADAEAMGYAIAILPGLLLGGIIAVCDELLEAVKVSGRYHDIGSFASDVSQLSRIVTLNDIALSVDNGEIAMDATASREPSWISALCLLRTRSRGLARMLLLPIVSRARMKAVVFPVTKPNLIPLVGADRGVPAMIWPICQLTKSSK